MRLVAFTTKSALAEQPTPPIEFTDLDEWHQWADEVQSDAHDDAVGFCELLECAISDLESAKDDKDCATDAEERADARENIACAKDEVDTEAEALWEWQQTPLSLGAALPSIFALRPRPPPYVAPAEPPFVSPERPSSPVAHAPLGDVNPRLHRKLALANTRNPMWPAGAGVLLLMFGALVSPVTVQFGVCAVALVCLGLAFVLARKRSELIAKASVAANAEFEVTRQKYEAKRAQEKADWMKSISEWEIECNAAKNRHDRYYASLCGVAREASIASLADWEAERIALREKSQEVSVRVGLAAALGCSLVTPLNYPVAFELDGQRLVRTHILLPVEEMLPEFQASRSKAGIHNAKERSDAHTKRTLLALGKHATLTAAYLVEQIVDGAHEVPIVGWSGACSEAWAGEVAECARLKLQPGVSVANSWVGGLTKDAFKTLKGKLTMAGPAEFKPIKRRLGKWEFDAEFVQVAPRETGHCRVCDQEVTEAHRLDAHLFVFMGNGFKVWYPIHATCSPVECLKTKKATNEQFRGQRFTLPINKP